MNTLWITFYSYKGGVGRSMALANTAALMAREGRRVLMVDFDLEAPGLDTFEEFKLPQESAGMVEYVSTYRDTRKVPPVAGFVHEINAEDVRRGKLWLMTSGKKDANYNRKRTEINWSEFYQSEAGALFFENFKADIEDTYKPDYVLIDSRTGLTDVGGVCTAHLPDLVVLLFSLNEQNLRGIASVAKVLQKSERKPQLIPVATPVPNLPRDSKSLIDERYARAKELLGVDVELSLNYAPQVSLREQIYTWGISTPLAFQYRALRDKIAGADPEGIDYLIRQAQEAVEGFDLDRAKEIEKVLQEDYADRADAWKSIAELRKLDGDMPGYEEALRSTLDLNPGDDETYSKISNLLKTRKRIDDLIALTETLLAKTSLLSAEEVNSLRDELGCLYMGRNRPADALACLQENLIHAREKNPGGAPDISLLVANFNYSEAARRARKFEECQWPEVVRVFEALNTAVSSGELSTRMNQMQAMHIAYACSGSIPKAKELLLDAEKLAQHISPKQRLFCVALYEYGPVETFLDYNTKMLDALNRQELWDGMKLPHSG